jgi:hypothetical protein
VAFFYGTNQIGLIDIELLIGGLHIFMCLFYILSSLIKFEYEDKDFILNSLIKKRQQILG